MSNPLPGFGKGDSPRQDPVFCFDAGWRGCSAFDARVIWPDAKAFPILVADPPRRIAAIACDPTEFAVECSLICNIRRLHAAATRTQFDKLAIDALDLRPRMYGRSAA